VCSGRRAYAGTGKLKLPPFHQAVTLGVQSIAQAERCKYQQGNKEQMSALYAETRKQNVNPLVIWPAHCQFGTAKH